MDVIKEYGTIPKWIWNVSHSADMDRDRIDAEMRAFAQADKNRGVMFVLWAFDDYGTEVFWERYRWGLESARKYGLDVTFWDENGFPSGQAGQQLMQFAPEAVASRLDMEKIVIKSGETGEIILSDADAASLMAAVAMDMHTCNRVAVPCENGVIRHTADADTLLMAFVCRRETAKPGFGGLTTSFVNYLEPDAVDKLIECTYQRFYDRFSEYFGSTIRYAFYDEPSMYQITDGRIWTRRFNEWFEKENGYDPSLLYPALFMDIGADTVWARCALFGLRNKLFAESYVGRLNTWCESHGLVLTGHTDQEEIPNHTLLSGDMMYTLSRQGIPGVDSIFNVGRSSKPFRVIGSIPWNFGQERVMCEVYGAMSERLPIDDLYREGMDMLARGINFIVPHGTWYENTKNVIFPPELSYRSGTYGSVMPALNTWFARCCRYLSGGMEETGLGLYVPVESMISGSSFAEGYSAYLGGKCTSPVNYMDVGEQLISLYGCEVVYVHPLSVKDGKLNRLKGLVLPEMDVIDPDCLEKIVSFARQGGRVYAAGRLPSRGSLPGSDERVAALTQELMTIGTSLTAAAQPETTFSDNGLRRLVLRKEKDGQKIVFFANMDVRPAWGELSLPGERQYEMYDPHREIYTIPEQRTENGRTIVQMGMPAAECRILLSK